MRYYQTCLYDHSYWANTCSMRSLPFIFQCKMYPIRWPIAGCDQGPLISFTQWHRPSINMTTHKRWKAGVAIHSSHTVTQNCSRSWFNPKITANYWATMSIRCQEVLWSGGFAALFERLPSCLSLFTYLLKLF